MQTRPLCSLGIVLALAISGCRAAPAPPPDHDAPVPPSPAPQVSALAERSAPAARAEDAGREPIASPLALPGAAGPAFLDYIAYEPGRSRVWVPVPSTASVDVLDTARSTFTRIDGFKSASRDWKGRMRTFGPSAVTVGDGFAYVGNRATSEVCPVALESLALGTCFKIAGSLDGIAYVASAKEVWITGPEEQSLTVLDASVPQTLKRKTTLSVGGAPEGYAVDDTRGFFFTNLEDKGGTLAVDIKSHKIAHQWDPHCGAAGPRGVAVDSADGLVIVACTDHVQVLDAGHDGARLGVLDTGEGVDNIDFVEALHTLYVAAGKAARLTIARLSPSGTFTIVDTIPTKPGARNAVADAKGNAYVADSQNAQLVVVRAR